MQIDMVIERAQRVATVRDHAEADPDLLKQALRATAELAAWLAASEADLAHRLSEQVAFAEHHLAESTNTSQRTAGRVLDRVDTLSRLPRLAQLLDDGRTTSAHLDAITRCARSLDHPDQRAEFYTRVDRLDAAVTSSDPSRFARRVRRLAVSLREASGLDRFARQRADNRLRTWVDHDGMWRFDGRFDPLTGAHLAQRLRSTADALFATAVPDDCPRDPIDKQQHLHALSLRQLILEPDSVVSRSSRPELLVVIDTTTDASTSGRNTAAGPDIDWGIPVEVPHEVLAELSEHATSEAVVVNNGVIAHAPGTLNLGRSTRLANRAQRRALRALYSTCAIPGCEVHYQHCKLHHVVWWRHGGTTDLDNLLPLCSQHHTKVHHHDWELQLAPDRQLTVRFPDGTVRIHGPPRHERAA